jgi:membrane-bound lytic murein transglycosylase D
MAKNAERYGLDDLRMDEAPPIDQVTIRYPVDLRLVAECAETTVANLQDLNPSLLRMTTPKDQEFTLNLPAGTGKRFEQIIASIPTDKRVWWRYHKVQNGESLDTIARRYRTSPASIAEVNNLEDEAELLRDARLVIPVTPGRSIEEGAMQYSKRPTYYKVRKGDTVASVADDFGVTVSSLRKWNRLRGNALRRGRSLKIYRPVVAEDPILVASARKPKTTKVAPTKLQPVNIVEADDEDDEELVTDPSPAPKSASTHKPAPEHAAANKARIYHKVRQGDTLYSIAIEYNTTVANLRRDNRKYAKVIKPGDVILVRR